ncbi:MAG: BlaI/MecI/CopY family transcriptional regulator [Actinomycetota bacterium]|nr:BlaI/MecI/CopY family transcriptional regulator [Actinomycetota bacterium]
MRPFGELEAAVMQQLWERDRPATVRELLAELQPHRSVAYTTVMTVLDNLHRKGAVTREMQGRAWRYAPVRSREEHTAALLRDVLAAGGDRRAALLHFVAELEPDEIGSLQAAVEAARRARKPAP